MPRQYGVSKMTWVTDGTDQSWSILDINNNRIASVWRESLNASDNARLIAAAPDLMAALQQIANFEPPFPCGNAEEFTQRAYDAVRLIADAAIAKAQGEQS
jgi:hypothetical protein